jgi:hypothetical protein
MQSNIPDLNFKIEIKGISYKLFEFLNLINIKIINLQLKMIKIKSISKIVSEKKETVEPWGIVIVY